jgi:predicted ATPase
MKDITPSNQQQNSTTTFRRMVHECSVRKAHVNRAKSEFQSSLDRTIVYLIRNRNEISLQEGYRTFARRFNPAAAEFYMARVKLIINDSVALTWIMEGKTAQQAYDKALRNWRKIHRTPSLELIERVRSVKETMLKYKFTREYMCQILQDELKVWNY